MATMAPVGLLGKVPPRCRVRLLDANGTEIKSPSSGRTVQAVDVVDEMTGGSTKYPRNEQGGFFRIYQVRVCEGQRSKLRIW